MPIPHSADLRKGRCSEIGRVYLVTTVTHRRTPVFSDFSLARLAIHALRECDTLGLTSTLAFVLMPDHLHWLVELHASHLSDVAKRFKSASSRVINRARNLPGERLWQPGFHDHAVRREEDILGIARYIVANPLRANLVVSVREYPHWDAVWL